MTQQQIEHPRNLRGQIQDVRDAKDINEINQRLRGIYNVVNNLPGTSEWLYVGKDVPFLNAWVSYTTVDQQFGTPRFRRIGYDTVEIEGTARQNPFNAANIDMWRMPEGFIPDRHKTWINNSAGGAGPFQVVGYASTTTANIGLVRWAGGVSTDFVHLDGAHYSLTYHKF